MVESEVRFCMITWLPRRRTSVKPLRARIWQTSRPERTRNLPKRNLEPGNEDLGVQAPLNFGRVSRFEKQLNRFDQIAARTFDGITLAGDVQLRA